jgi:hypothetical protein
MGEIYSSRMRASVLADLADLSELGSIGVPPNTPEEEEMLFCWPPKEEKEERDYNQEHNSAYHKK